jgi:hypothetical protein
LANAVDELPAATARKISTAQALAEAQATEAARAAALAAEQKASPWLSLLLPKAKHSAMRTLTSSVDAAVEAASGGALKSSPVSVTQWWNIFRDPRAQYAVGGAMQKYLTPLGNSAPMAAGAATVEQEERDAAAVSHFLQGN